MWVDFWLLGRVFGFFEWIDVGGSKVSGSGDRETSSVGVFTNISFSWERSIQSLPPYTGEISQDLLSLKHF